jgi:flagellar protein FlgJ
MSGGLTLSPATSLAVMQASEKATMDAHKKVIDVKEEKRIHDAANEFESVFVSEMIKPMFEGISTEAPFGGGKGEEIFRGMMVQEYGKILSKTGGLGLSPQIADAMIKMQEQANNAQ